jgi:hypothetical protein
MKINRRKIRRLVEREIRRQTSSKRQIDEAVGGMVGLQPIHDMSSPSRQDDFTYRGLEDMKRGQLDIVTESIDETVSLLREAADGSNNDKISRIVKRLGEIREDIENL